MSESFPIGEDKPMWEDTLLAAPVAELLRDPQVVTGLGIVLGRLEGFKASAVEHTDPNEQPVFMKCTGESSITPNGQFVAGFEQGAVYSVFVFNLSELRSPDFALRPIEINPSPFATMTFRDGSDTVEVQGIQTDGNEVTVHMSNPLDWELDPDGRGIGITIECNGAYEQAEPLAELGRLLNVKTPTCTIRNESIRK